jgi:hypothetical protein
MSTREAAEYCGLSPRTLERLRVQGGGPEYERPLRRCLYTVEALERWLTAGRRKSTSVAAMPANEAA